MAPPPNPVVINPPHPHIPPKGPPHANYPYDASKAAALIFCVVFALCLLVHFGQAIRYRTFWVWPLIIGLIFEVVGFAMRWYSIEELFTNWPSIISQVCVIVAPAFIAAQNYMLAGRLMSYVGKEFSPVSHTLITKVFVLCDVVSIITQGVSASLLNSHDFPTMRTGFRILIAALVFQVIMFLIFVGITIVFDKRSRQALGASRKPVQLVFIAFYASAGLIILRSVYRTFEFSTVKFGPNTPASGYSLNHEWLLYVFDALPITAAVIVLSVIHAGRYLPGNKGLRIDGTVEEPQPSRVCGCCCIYKRPKRVVSLKHHRDDSSYEGSFVAKGVPLLPREHEQA